MEIESSVIFIMIALFVGVLWFRNFCQSHTNLKGSRWEFLEPLLLENQIKQNSDHSQSEVSALDMLYDFLSSNFKDFQHALTTETPAVLAKLNSKIQKPVALFWRSKSASMPASNEVKLLALLFCPSPNRTKGLPNNYITKNGISLFDLNIFLSNRF